MSGHLFRRVPQLCGGAGEENQRGNTNQGTEVGASLLYLENSIHGVGRAWAVGRASVPVPEVALQAGGNIKVLCAVVTCWDFIKKAGEGHERV